MLHGTGSSPVGASVLVVLFCLLTLRKFYEIKQHNRAASGASTTKETVMSKIHIMILASCTTMWATGTSVLAAGLPVVTLRVA